MVNQGRSVPIENNSELMCGLSPFSLKGVASIIIMRQISQLNALDLLTQVLQRKLSH